MAAKMAALQFRRQARAARSALRRCPGLASTSYLRRRGDRRAN